MVDGVRICQQCFEVVKERRSTGGETLNLTQFAAYIKQTTSSLFSGTERGWETKRVRTNPRVICLVRLMARTGRSGGGRSAMNAL